MGLETWASMPAALVAAMSSAKALGRHGDDGHLARVRPPQGADAARGLAAVHHRHLHVHEDGVEGESLRLSEALDSLRAVPSLRDGHAVHLQKLGGDLHVDLVVLGQQYAPALKGECLFPIVRRLCGLCLLVGDGKGQDDGEGRALAGSAFDVYLAVHLRDDALGDRHAQPRTHGLALAKAHLAAVRLEQVRKILPGHADACIGDDEAIFAQLAGRGLHLRDGDADAVALAGELDGVGEQVVHHLTDAEGSPITCASRTSICSVSVLRAASA